MDPALGGTSGPGCGPDCHHPYFSKVQVVVHVVQVVNVWFLYVVELVLLCHAGAGSVGGIYGSADSAEGCADG